MPVFCKHESKLKMVILTKNGHQNAVWFSRLREDAKFDSETVMAKMINRFENDKLAPFTQTLQFYDNQTGQLIKQVPS